MQQLGGDITQALRGVPTYRVAHHPDYKRYFAGAPGSLNLQHALLVADAQGRRHIYTRLVGGKRVWGVAAAGLQRGACRSSCAAGCVLQGGV